MVRLKNYTAIKWLARAGWLAFVFPLSFFVPLGVPGSSEGYFVQITGWVAHMVWFIVPVSFWETNCTFSRCDDVRGKFLRIGLYSVAGLFVYFLLTGRFGLVSNLWILPQCALQLGICAGATVLVAADLASSRWGRLLYGDSGA